MGILSRPFGTRARHTTRPLMSIAEAQRIINAYAIKEALMIGIVAAQDENARTLLRNGYVTLADWQEGIGPGPHDLDLADRPGETIQENVKRVREVAPAYLELSKRVTAEMAELLTELNSNESKLRKTLDEHRNQSEREQ
jgi:hypothetical protein